MGCGCAGFKGPVMPFFSFGRKKEAKKAAAPAPPSTHVTVTLYCPAHAGAAEDAWQVEVPRGATIAELKAKVAELYEVPVELQEIRRDVDSASLADTDPLDTDPRLNEDVLHLLVKGQQGPLGALFGGDMSGLMNMAQGFLGNLANVVNESAQMNEAMEQSLADVTYNLNVVLPGRAGKADTRCKLPLSAMAFVGDVTEAARLELNIGSAQHFQLTYGGQALPESMTVHAAGLRDGDTLLAQVQQEVTEL